MRAPVIIHPAEGLHDVSYAQGLAEPSQTHGAAAAWHCYDRPRPRVGHRLENLVLFIFVRTSVRNLFIYLFSRYPLLAANQPLECLLALDDLLC